MNPEEFEKMLLHKQAELRAYVYNDFPRKAGEISLRFIDRNFRDQGYHGTTFQSWKPLKKRQGTILVITGRLRRGNYFETSPGIAHIKNDVPYASAHNNGFNGIVQIKSYQRRSLSGKKMGTGRIRASSGKAETRTIHGISGTVNVKSHARKMNIPQRKFFPTSWDDSPVLANELINEVSNGMKKIFK
jgi:phage gpG-like protein